jgi:hypothetical protein
MRRRFIGRLDDAQGIAGHGRLLLVPFLDAFTKAPIPALRFISRHCGVSTHTPLSSKLASLDLEPFSKPSFCHAEEK